MPDRRLPVTASVAIRCDGGSHIGAGHVGRCLPIARALSEAGVKPIFVGRYDHVADWMLVRAGWESAAPESGPCGVRPERHIGAIVDLYLPENTEVCQLAAALPVATIGEATRCPDRGTWVDFHAGSLNEQSATRLGGIQFAPVDPRFVASRRERSGVRRILLMAGATQFFDDATARLAAVTSELFPEAELLTPSRVAGVATTTLETPFELTEVAATIDLAVVAAGMTAYELAAAGVPVVAVALVENQRIVARGCQSEGIAFGVDAVGEDPALVAVDALTTVQDPDARARLSTTAMRKLDGLGSARIAQALVAAWGQPGKGQAGR